MGQSQKQPLEVFCKKMVFIKILHYSQEKTCSRVSFFDKVAGQRLWHRSFPVNFAKFLRTPFWQNTSGWPPPQSLRSLGPKIYNPLPCHINFANTVRNFKVSVKTSKLVVSKKFTKLLFLAHHIYRCFVLLLKLQISKQIILVCFFLISITYLECTARKMQYLQ